MWQQGGIAMIKGKTEAGLFCVRPYGWAGVWNSNGELVSGRTLFISAKESDCDDYIRGRESGALLKRLNEIPIIESSCSCGDLDYVLIENTKENRTILKELGMHEEDEAYMIDDEEGPIEISFFAFEKLGAEWWNSKTRFGLEPEGL
jgi:hypothetical protein